MKKRMIMAGIFLGMMLMMLPPVFGFQLPDKATTQSVAAITNEAPFTKAFVSSNGDCGIEVPCYSKIQEAIAAAPGGSYVVLVRRGTYNESISPTSGKTVIVKGGYNSTYSQQTDNATFVYGQTLQASSGSLKYQMLSIRLHPGGGTWTDPVTGMEFVWVEGGCYEMGCGDWTGSCDDNESPVHEKYA